MVKAVPGLAVLIRRIFRVSCLCVKSSIIQLLPRGSLLRPGRLKSHFTLAFSEKREQEVADVAEENARGGGAMV